MNRHAAEEGGIRQGQLGKRPRRSFPSCSSAFLARLEADSAFPRRRRTLLRVRPTSDSEKDGPLTLGLPAGIALARSDDWISHSPADVGAHKVRLAVFHSSSFRSCSHCSSPSRPRRLPRSPTRPPKPRTPLPPPRLELYHHEKSTKPVSITKKSSSTVRFTGNEDRLCVYGWEGPASTPLLSPSCFNDWATSLQRACIPCFSGGYFGRRSTITFAGARTACLPPRILRRPTCSSLLASLPSSRSFPPLLIDHC